MTNSPPTSPRRPYDAQASREALLDAAAELFDERGFERATTREIGERAGVDPALIARYFDSKEGLYLAVLTDPARVRPVPVDDHSFGETARDLLGRWEGKGQTPLRRALVSPEPTAEVRAQMREILDRRMLAPLTEMLTRRGVAASRLRAEVLLAVLTGLTLLRTNGILEELESASIDEVLAVIEPMLDALEEAPRSA